MKKILSYIIIILLILGSLITVLIFNKNEDIYNSIVYIEAQDEKIINSGTGFVYKKEKGINYIVTSYHIIENYKDIYVYNKDKEKSKANILNYDEYADIAILTIKDNLGLKKINIDNSDNIKINDNIYVIGALEKIWNINRGIISHINKEVNITTTHGTSNLNTIEINIDVTYGNSGSPLFNKNNKVIGMVFAKENDKAYALPIDFVIEIVAKLENQQLNKPNLGAVMCNSTNKELLNEYGININDIQGVVLLELNENYPLYNVGLQKGDIITKFNKVKINNINMLKEELYKKEIGNIIEIEYYRNQNYHKVNIRL